MLPPKFVIMRYLAETSIIQNTDPSEKVCAVGNLRNCVSSSLFSHNACNERKLVLRLVLSGKICYVAEERLATALVTSTFLEASLM